MKLLKIITGCVAFFCVTLSTSAAGRDSGKPLWLVVTRPGFVEAVQPLADKRRKDGFRTEISIQPIAQALAAKSDRPAFVLLVGDDQAGHETQPWYLPAKRVKLYRWRATQRKQFASDAAWGDFDGDGIPDAPVGRIPARSADQVRTVVRKILSYEKQAPSLDDLRLPIWAGAPGYNAAIDSLATTLVVNTARARAPAWSRLWIISGDGSSALCGWPADQPRLFTQQLRRGGFLACLMGHGDADSFFSMNAGFGRIEYTAPQARELLAGGEPAPPMVIFACDSGDFARERPCLAESLLWLPGGPVATIAATTESHPLTNYFSAVCLLQALGAEDDRLGTVWLAAQKHAMKAGNFVVERLLRDVEGKLDENIDVARLRGDQMLMYALLGDPATRLRLPGKLHGKIRPHGAGWRWSVRKPEGATKLHVSFRPADQSLPAVEGDLKPDAVRGKFQAADKVFEFQPLATLAGDVPWEGTVREEGTLRLVATVPERGKLYVAAIRLRRPAKQPGPGAP